MWKIPYFRGFPLFCLWMVWVIFQPNKSKMILSGHGWKAHQTPVRPYYLWYVCNLYMNLYVQAKFHPDTLDYLNYLLFFPKWSASQNLTDKLHRTQAGPCATSPWLASPSTMGSKTGYKVSFSCINFHFSLRVKWDFVWIKSLSLAWAKCNHIIGPLWKFSGDNSSLS